MSSELPPDNGYYSGVIYNPDFFLETTTTGGASQQWVEENFLERVGNPDDIADTTTFTGQIISTNTTSASETEASILTSGGITCNELYVTSGTITGIGANIFTSSETTFIGEQNNGSVYVATLTANSTSYGITSAGPVSAGTNISAEESITAGQNITATGNVQGYYVTGTEGLVSENLYESVTGGGTGNPTVYCASSSVSIATQASTINVGTSCGGPQTISFGNVNDMQTTFDINGFVNVGQYMNIAQAINMWGALNINQAVSTYSGGSGYVSGQVYISQPFQGQSFKVALIIINNLTTSGSLNYTYVYPTPFSSTVCVLFPSANLQPQTANAYGLSMSVSSTLTELTFAVFNAATNNGLMLVIGR